MALYFLSWADYSLWTRSTTDINLCALLYLLVLRSWQGCLNIALRKVSAIEGSWRLTILSGKITYLQNSNCWSHQCDISSAQLSPAAPSGDLPCLFMVSSKNQTWRRSVDRHVAIIATFHCTFTPSDMKKGIRLKASVSPVHILCLKPLRGGQMSMQRIQKNIGCLLVAFQSFICCLNSHWRLILSYFNLSLFLHNVQQASNLFSTGFKQAPNPLFSGQKFEVTDKSKVN